MAAGTWAQGSPDPGAVREAQRVEQERHNDANAIAEAAARPMKRFGEIKSKEQADLQALHRVRDQMIGTRTHSLTRCEHSAWNMALH
ncbi:hypothetical protein [Mesorhizobium sp.]|uniref:hypothetical protein n=1 Tax=Mesorhizobium sp. TaxID=1871066 RepID=UPI0025F6D23B|nr:hypothetical protein [Mesorhizobium sp.]